MTLFSSDYNCHLMPHMQELLTSMDEASNALLLMHEKLEIKHFYMMPRYDKGESPIAFCLRRDRILERLREQLPKELVLKPSCAVLFSKGLFETAYLERLFISRSKRLLPLEMPLSLYEHWMDEELNRLLYVRHCKPFFLSFERYIVLYPKEIVQKLMRIPDACFQFSFSSLDDESICTVILQLLHQGSSICFGSGMNSLQKVRSMDFDNCEKSLKKPFQQAVIRQILTHKKQPF